jgi:hypothetical protein
MGPAFFNRFAKGFIMPRILALILLALVASAQAVDETPPAGLAPVPEPPDIPPPLESGETMEPDVTIIRKGKETIEEYRVNNRLYMVKIKPAIGPAYYLIDSDGDGRMDRRRGTVEEGMQIPQWVLFSW